MADDIVTRLRNSCAHKCSVCDRQNAYAVGDDAVEYIRAQQAEIERLRAKVAHLSAWPSFCDRPTECDVCGDVYRSEEARRG